MPAPAAPRTDAVPREETRLAPLWRVLLHNDDEIDVFVADPARREESLGLPTVGTGVRLLVTGRSGGDPLAGN
jgi:hypothetical protein